MEKNEQYKPGLHKLLFHLEHLQKIISGDICGPIHVSVWPTNKCQLNCSYCCFKNVVRDDTELDMESFKYATDVLVKYGLKALEFSGGGEPLLWKHFYEGVNYAYDKGLKLSLVTNGLLLPEISKKILKKFTWIRVSVQSLGYAKKINFGFIPPEVKHSASFIVPNEDKLHVIKNLYPFAKENNLIIRVAPARPCTIEWEQEIKDEVDKFGYPLLFFKKEAGKPLGCYFPYIRAAIDWRGMFLQCPSTELSYEHAGDNSDKFALCKVEDLEEWLINNPPHSLEFDCTFCNCGKEVNDTIFNLKNKSIEDVDFV